MIRNEYRFPRPLTEAETALLVQLIGWRHGSHVVADESGATVGCIAHPDDLAEFEKELRKARSAKGEARVCHHAKSG